MNEKEQKTPKSKDSWLEIQIEEITLFFTPAIIFIQANLIRVIFSCLLFIAFIFFEKSLLTKSSDFFSKYSEISNSSLFQTIFFVTFCLVCIVLRKRKKIFPIDLVVIAIYLKYICFPQPIFKADGSSLDLWEVVDVYNIHIRYIDLVLLYYTSWFFCKSYYKSIADDKVAPIVYETGVFYPDLTIRDLAKKNNTKLKDEDEYSMGRFAREIVSSIEVMRPFKAFAIGISGQWGSGKSSLFSMIKEELESSKHQIKVLEFSPWYYSKSEALIVDFFKLLEENFQSNSVLKRNLISYAKELASIEVNIFKTKFLKDFFPDNKNLEEMHSKIEEELRKQKNLSVIMIDDLDRLDKKEIISILKLIRVIADFPNLIYLVAYDRQYINAAIKIELTDHLPEKFVDKIFNMEFQVPPASPDKIFDQLRKILFASLNLIIENEEDKVTDKQIKDILKKAKIECFIRNQRDVKRFTNNFIMCLKPVLKVGIHLETFLLLQLINYKYPKIYKRIYDSQSSLLEHFSKAKRDSKDNSISVFSEILKLKHKQRLEVSEIIYRCFKSTNKYGISNKQNFYKYFSLTTFGNEIKGSDVEDALKLDGDALVKRIDDFFEVEDDLLIEILGEKMVSAFSNIELEKSLKVLHWIYVKYEDQKSAPDISEEDVKKILEKQEELARIVSNILANTNLNEKFKMLNEIFRKDVIEGESLIYQYLEKKNQEYIDNQSTPGKL